LRSFAGVILNLPRPNSLERPSKKKNARCPNILLFIYLFF
jgi:hypothetical protein